MNKLFCVIPAAGIGARMQSDIPKQYLSVEGRSVIEHSILKILTLSQVQQVIVALHKNDTYFSQLPIARHPKVTTVVGGAKRQQSVLNALFSIKDRRSWVLVHDAVRPCVSTADIKKLINKAVAANTGAILVTPVVNTIKLADADDCVSKTLVRSQLRQALTPQLFDKDLLQVALLEGEKRKIEFTDEAAAIEFAGYRVILVDSDPCNIKLTTKNDLYMLQHILQKQKVVNCLE